MTSISHVLNEEGAFIVQHMQDPTEKEQLARTSRAASCPDFVDVVDNYTLLLHQGLIEKAFLEEIEHVSIDRCIEVSLTNETCGLKAASISATRRGRSITVWRRLPRSSIRVLQDFGSIA